MYLKDCRDRAPGGLLVPVEWQADADDGRADEHHDGGEREAHAPWAFN